jgi:K(+)-stimulated pyrophosphate-energized sodium pump
VADGAGSALADVVSGFHDASGDPAKNAALSKQRAMAVTAALTAAGVPDDKIELRKPADMTAGGDAAQARRVEVTLE